MLYSFQYYRNVWLPQVPVLGICIKLLSSRLSMLSSRHLLSVHCLLNVVVNNLRFSFSNALGLTFISTYLLQLGQLQDHERECVLIRTKLRQYHTWLYSALCIITGSTLPHLSELLVVIENPSHDMDMESNHSYDLLRSVEEPLPESQVYFSSVLFSKTHQYCNNLNAISKHL